MEFLGHTGKKESSVVRFAREGLKDTDVMTGGQSIRIFL